jgi:hypothetical protein
MEIVTKACNVCERQKQETNHWLFAIAFGDRLLFSIEQPVISIGNPVIGDVCGAACAHTLLSQWLTRKGI